MLEAPQDQGSDLWLDLADPEDGEGELERLRAFLARHPSGNLAPRPDEQFRASIEGALSFRVQTRPTLTTPDAQHIAAQGAVFDHGGGAFELGAISVSPTFQGLRLQAWMMRVAIRHLYDVEGLSERRSHVYAGVAEANEASWRSIEKVGMHRAGDDHPVWAHIPKSPEEMRAAAKRIYVLPVEGIIEINNAILDLAKNPMLGAEGRARLRFGRRLQRFEDSRYLTELARGASNTSTKGQQQ